MDFWIFLVPGLVLITILLVYRLENMIKWYRIVKADFLNARGSIHRKIIQDCLVNLNRNISDIDTKMKSLSLQKADLETKREKELETKLTAQIVDSEFTIPGIGNVLKDRILRQCFNGTLESLNNAGNVHGIGYEKGRAVSQWVKRTRARMPQLLLGDFPEKPQIIKKYIDLDDKVVQEINTVNSELLKLQQLKDEASAALNSLQSVSRSTFSKAYKGDVKSADTMAQYLLGVYPEWGTMPSWFKTLVEKHGPS